MQASARCSTTSSAGRACGSATSTFGCELGLQESARAAVLGRYGVTFISRSAIEAELASGRLAAASVEGLEPAREISLVRAAGRLSTRAADAFVAFAAERLA